jgi:cAMP-dependent protein kinase regulator
VKKNSFRRVSVAAERYNPEDDDDSDDEKPQIYPKTVEQRKRLRDAVCHNFLFRTLEAKQIDQILDTMWEKHIQKGEYIIQQGKFIFINSFKSHFFCCFCSTKR